jgi:hypothetical protein
MLAPKLTPQGWVLKLLKAGTLLDTGAVNADSKERFKVTELGF